MFSWNEKKIIVAFFDDVNRELERIRKKSAGVIKLTPIETYAELEKEFITLERVCKGMSQQTMRILPNDTKKLEENLEKTKLTLRVHKDDTRQWLLKIAIQTEEFGKLDCDDVQMMFEKIKDGLNKRGIGELRGYSTNRKEIPTVDVVLSRRQILCFNSCLKAIHEEKWLSVIHEFHDFIEDYGAALPKPITMPERQLIGILAEYVGELEQVQV